MSRITVAIPTHEMEGGPDFLEHSFGILKEQTFKDFDVVVSDNSENDEIELVCLSGRSALGDDSTIWTSFSLDGETWSVERGIQAGKQGQRNKRLAWLCQGHIDHWRIQKFRGTSDAHIPFARLDALVEPLYV